MVYSIKPATLQKLWQQLWWHLVSHLLNTVNCATKLTVVIFNTYTQFANSLSANADICNGLVFLKCLYFIH